jgi:cyclophilin family peptidyl-prolyl cis-trans isomerase
MRWALSLVLVVTTGLSTAGAGPLPARLPVLRSDLVVMETSLGTVKIRLYPDKAPATVQNFLGYVDAKFYDDTIFHRVIPNFMIQGGGLDAHMNEKPARPPVKNESANGLSNRRGTIAVARTAIPDSGTCQFFINVKDNPFLDRAKFNDGAGYCVFGEVVEGMDVVDAITRVATGEKPPHRDVPLQPVLIRTLRRAP